MSLQRRSEAIGTAAVIPDGGRRLPSGQESVTRLA